MRHSASRWKQFLLVIAIVILIAIGIAGAKIVTDPIKPWMHESSWSAAQEAIVTPNLKVKGTVESFELDYIRTSPWNTYHKFPAAIVLNETQKLWTSNPEWDNRSRIMVGYDYKDVPNLVPGMRVEVYGYLDQTLDTAYSNLLVVGPQVNISYVELLP